MNTEISYVFSDDDDDNYWPEPELIAKMKTLFPLVRDAFPLMAEPQWLSDDDNAKVRRLNRELKSQGFADLQFITNESYRRMHPGK